MPATLLSSGFAFYPSYHLSLLKRFILISTAIPITDRPFCPRHGAGSLDFHWCVLGRLPSQKAVGVEWWTWSAMGATGPLPKPWEVGKLGVRKCSWPGIQMGATGKNQESSGGLWAQRPHCLKGCGRERVNTVIRWLLGQEPGCSVRGVAGGAYVRSRTLPSGGSYRLRLGWRRITSLPGLKVQDVIWTQAASGFRSVSQFPPSQPYHSRHGQCWAQKSNI